MTTLAAVARDGYVYMAADTATNVYDRPMPGSVTKILGLRSGDEVLLAACGQAGLLGVFAAGLTPDVLPATPAPNVDPQPWAHSVAVAASQLAVTAGLVENGKMDGSLLLGWGGRVWTLSHSAAVPHLDGIATLGSGEGPAIGVLDALLARGVPPASAVHEAVLVATRRDRYSDGPIQVETLKPAVAAHETVGST